MATDVSQDLLSRIEAWAKEQPEIVALYLFGSQVQGNTHPGSDVDVGVLARLDLSKEELWRLQDRWSASVSALGTGELDLSVLNLAPVPFRFEVTTRGRLLWTADISGVVEFESITLRRYWDLKPILDAYWEAAVSQLMEAGDEAERRQHEAALRRVRDVHSRAREASVPSGRPVASAAVQRVRHPSRIGGGARAQLIKQGQFEREDAR